MKLLIETIDDFEILTEAKEDGSRKYKIRGNFMQHSVKNRNGRLYPESVMIPEVNRYIKEKVERNSAYGTFGHENTPKVSEEKISHRITKLYQDGTNIVGEANILDNPNGNLIKSIIDDGGSMGASSRAVGSVKSINGINEVQNDFKISCVDLVIDPSGQNCFINGIMEDAEWLYIEGKGWIPQYIEESQNLIDKTIRYNKQDIDRIAIQIFDNFMKRL